MGNANDKEGVERPIPKKKKMPNEIKNVLIVYAHQDPHSFNASLKNGAVQSLEAQGMNVEISDLYAMHFEPRATRSDISGELTETKKFSYFKEVSVAYQEDRVGLDVRTEMDKLRKADLLILQFPLYWFNMPAIMKGWVDRVFINGFAFDFNKGHIYDNGLMSGKKAMLSITTGAPESFYTNKGLNGDIDVILWSMNYGMLRYVGFDVLKSQLSFAPGMATDTKRKAMVDKWTNRLEGITKEEPLKFIALEHFDYSNGCMLSDDYMRQTREDKTAATIGQHRNKPLPQKSAL